MPTKVGAFLRDACGAVKDKFVEHFEPEDFESKQEQRKEKAKEKRHRGGSRERIGRSGERNYSLGHLAAKKVPHLGGIRAEKVKDNRDHEYNDPRCRNTDPELNGKSKDNDKRHEIALGKYKLRIEKEKSWVLGSFVVALPMRGGNSRLI
jgi:hypothetical protein